MITEDYVSFETALLLKEKGFEQFGCHKQYNTQGDLCSGYCYGPVAPTLQMAMKWLREKYNLYIEVNLTFSENPEIYHPRYYVYVLETKSGNSLIHKAATIEELNPLAHKNGFPKNFNTYEEACEVAIKYCLENLI